MISIRTAPPRQLRMGVMFLRKIRDGVDTLDLAKAWKIPEAEVWNAIAAYKRDVEKPRPR